MTIFSESPYGTSFLSDDSIQFVQISTQASA